MPDLGDLQNLVQCACAEDDLKAFPGFGCVLAHQTCRDDVHMREISNGVRMMARL